MPQIFFNLIDFYCHQVLSLSILLHLSLVLYQLLFIMALDVCNAMLPLTSLILPKNIALNVLSMSLLTLKLINARSIMTIS